MLRAASLAASTALALVAQLPFDQAARDLESADMKVRLRAVRMLKQGDHPEAAVPLAMLVTDSDDEVQLEAIAAELNLFLADGVVPRRRLGLVVEVRNAISAEAAFSAGPLAIGERAVPIAVLDALRTAVRDENPRVGLEALYAFGALASEPGDGPRRELLRTSGPELAALVGVLDPAVRFAAVRVLGRLFERRSEDDRVEDDVGDAVIAALNDKERAIKSAAMQALGAMRYERAVQALSDFYQYYARGDLAEAAFDGLARIANPCSAPLLSAGLTSRSAAIRRLAAEGLARLGDPGKLAAIRTAAGGERSDSVLLAAAFASAMLSNGSFDPIREALSKPRLRDQARQYLVELARGRSAILAGGLRDRDARVRADVLDAFALSGDAAALTLVEPLGHDPDPQVARAAGRAIARLQKHPAS